MKISQIASLISVAVALMPLFLSAGTVNVTSGPNFEPPGVFSENSIFANDPKTNQAVLAGSATIMPPTSDSAAINFSGTYAEDVGDLTSVAYTFSVDSNVTGNTTFEINGSTNPMATNAAGGGHFADSGTIMPGEHFYSAALPAPGPTKMQATGTFNLTLTFHFDSPASQSAPESPSPSSAAAGTINVTIGGVVLQVAPTAATPPAPGATPSPTPIGTPPPNSALLVNLSTRADVQTNDHVLIGGFIINGTGAKEVVLRGLGPSLPLTGTGLVDPVLELHKTDGSIVSNDNWMDNSAADQAVLTSNQLAPSSNLESAIVGNLDPGTYTVILSGKNSGTGVGLVEVYDLDTSSGAALANLSSRGEVETGENVLIGGFILGPSTATSSSVVVRALGPSLAATGVTDTLSDPYLELHDSNGALLASNDNWADGPDAQTIAEAGLAPTNALESALLLSSPSAAFTAVVSGHNGVTGVGLVEVYNLR